MIQVSSAQFTTALQRTLRQVRLPLATSMIIVAPAYLMNHLELAYTLGVGVALAGIFLPLLSAFVGSPWSSYPEAILPGMHYSAICKCFRRWAQPKSGSDGGNERIEWRVGQGDIAREHFNRHVVSKLQGPEGDILARTFRHSVVLTFLLGAIVMPQQFVFPRMIIG